MTRVLIYRADVWEKLAKQGFQLFLAKGKWLTVRRSREEEGGAREPGTFRLRYALC